MSPNSSNAKKNFGTDPGTDPPVMERARPPNKCQEQKTVENSQDEGRGSCWESETRLVDAAPEPNPYSHVSIAAVLALHTDAMRAVSVLGFAEYTGGMLTDLAERKKYLEEQLALERERRKKLESVAWAVLKLDPESLQTLAALRECLDAFNAEEKPDSGNSEPSASVASAVRETRSGSPARTEEESDGTQLSENDRTPVKEPDAGSATTAREQVKPPLSSKRRASRTATSWGVAIPATSFSGNFDSPVDMEVPIRDEEAEGILSGSRRLRATPQRVRKRIKSSSFSSGQNDGASIESMRPSPVDSPKPEVDSTMVQDAGNHTLAPASATASGSVFKSLKHYVAFGGTPAVQETIRKPKASFISKTNQKKASLTMAAAPGATDECSTTLVTTGATPASVRKAPRSRPMSHATPNSIQFDNSGNSHIRLAREFLLDYASPAMSSASPMLQKSSDAAVALLLRAPYASIVISRDHFDAYWRLKHPAPNRPRPEVPDCAGLTWDAKNPFPFPTLHPKPCGTLVALVGLSRVYGNALFVLVYLITGSEDGSPSFTLIPSFSKGDVDITAGERTGLTPEAEEELRAAKKRQCMTYGEISDTHAKDLLKYLEGLP